MLINLHEVGYSYSYFIFYYPFIGDVQDLIFLKKSLLILHFLWKGWVWWSGCVIFHIEAWNIASCCALGWPVFSIIHGQCIVVLQNIVCFQGGLCFAGLIDSFKGSYMYGNDFCSSFKEEFVNYFQNLPMLRKSHFFLDKPATVMSIISPNQLEREK